MSQHLPDHLDPWRFADLGNTLAGSFQLTSFSRLHGCLADPQGEVSFTLEFFRDRHHRACVQGVVEANLLLQCQRCLENMMFPIKSKVTVAFVEGVGEAERLPDELDPVLVENGQVRIKDLIEDELLLALPHVPMHSTDECPLQVDDFNDEIENKAVHENPFSVLTKLKK